MKTMNKEKEALKKASEQELAQGAELLRREYFTLKLNAVTAHVKDYSQFKKLRKNIARTLTYLRQKSAQ